MELYSYWKSDQPRNEKLWAKAVTGVDLTQPGGYALKGHFLPLHEGHDSSHRWTRYWISNENLSRHRGRPIIYGISDLDPGIQHAVLTIPSNVVAPTRVSVANYTFSNLGNRMIVSRNNMNKAALIAEIEQMGLTALPKINQYYWAAAFLKTHDHFDEPEVSDDSNKGVLFGTKPAVALSEKPIDAPKGYVWLRQKPDSLLLLVRLNDATLVDLTVLADTHGYDSAEMRELFREQAYILEQIAAAYRLLAYDGVRKRD